MKVPLDLPIVSPFTYVVPFKNVVYFTRKLIGNVVMGQIKIPPHPHPYPTGTLFEYFVMHFQTIKKERNRPSY